MAQLTRGALWFGIFPSLTLLVACGDVGVFRIDPGSIDPATIPDDHACFVGATVELSRHSSICDQVSQPLSSVMQAGVLFAAEEVQTLSSPCSSETAPGFEVVFDEGNNTVAFDFSTIGMAGRFPEARFEGYVFDVAIGEDNGTLLAVLIVQEASTLDVGADGISWDLDRIEVNLAGVVYDDRDLLTLELVFARVSPSTDDVAD